MDVKKLITNFKTYMHARNILMNVRNICIYFQKLKATQKRPLEVFCKK